MRRTSVILLCISLFSVRVMAQEESARGLGRLTFGAEWGYVATWQSGFHYNYFSPDGYREDERGNEFLYYSNADVYIHGGYDFNEYWNVSMYIGYAGVHDIHKVIPVSLRGTRYFGDDPLKDRWFTFVDLGSGICIKKEPQEILVGKIGGGYRISLSSSVKLDFLLSARITYTHPPVIHDGVRISLKRTNRNNAYVGAFSVGMGISF